MASITATFRDDSQVEVDMFGCESSIGASASMGTKRSLNRVYTQIAGNGFSTNLAAARREYCLAGLFQSLTLPGPGTNGAVHAVHRLQHET